MENKKKEERIVLDSFRDLLQDFPGGKLNPSESPDFILSPDPKKKIGIELTRLHKHPGKSDPFSFENISTCLLSKEDKLHLYRQKKLHEIWLILVVWDPAYKSQYNLHNKLIKWVFKSGFTRVFLYLFREGKIFELNTKSVLPS
jgi:hypothetical protein